MVAPEAEPAPASADDTASPPLKLALRGGLALSALATTLASAGAAFHRYLVNDDYAGLYIAWEESVNAVPGKDFVVYNDHACIHALAVLLRAFPESFTALYLFRLVMIACLGAIGFLVFRIARRLFDSRSAWFAPPMFGLSTLVLNRALDVRADLVSTLLWLAAVAVLVEPLAAADASADRPRAVRWLAFLGVLLGCMPVNFFKTVLPIPVFLAWVAVRYAWREPRTGTRLRSALVDVAIVAVAALGPVLVYAAFLKVSGALPSALAGTRAFFATIRQAPDDIPARMQTLKLLFDHDPWICVAIAAGMVLRLDAARRHDTVANAGVVGLLAIAALSVVLNPAYYAYNLVTLLPLLAPFGGFAVARLLRVVEDGARSAAAPLAALALFLVPLGRAHRTLFDLGLLQTNAHQLALHRYILDHVPRDEGVFALDGVGVFRPSVVHFWLVHVVRPRYEAGEFRYSDELRARPAALVLRNYRLPWWLTPDDRAFLRAHYVDLNSDFLVPGASSGGGQASVELLVPGVYEVHSASCRVDGSPVSSRLRLERGAHRLESDGPCILRLYVEPAARALLEMPTAVPYLVGPDYLVG